MDLALLVGDVGTDVGEGEAKEGVDDGEADRGSKANFGAGE